MRLNEKTRSRLIYANVIASIALMAFAGYAQAATVTVGASFTGKAVAGFCESACGFITLGVEAPSSATLAPADGTVTRWRLALASEVPGYSLNVLRKNSDGTYTVTASSAEVTPSGSGGVETFTTNLPIHAREYFER
jgi:hypothetical protein